MLFDQHRPRAFGGAIVEIITISRGDMATSPGNVPGNSLSDHANPTGEFASGITQAGARNYSVKSKGPSSGESWTA